LLESPTNPWAPASAGFFMVNQKSDYRLIIEKALRDRAGQELTNHQVAEITGIDRAKVIYVLHKLSSQGLRSRRSGNTYFYWFPETGNAPARRESVKREPWTGVDWSHSTSRPGCQDFLDHPSRRGDTLFPYKEPLLNASSAVTQKGNKK
jgi:hypothetical protein